jgi:hypothetical protein
MPKNRTMKKATLSFISFITFIVITAADTQAQRVERIDLSVDHPSYNGACPAKITFKAVIHYSGAGNLQYQWLRSDGAHAPNMTIKLDGSGTRVVNTSWQLGRSNNGWEAVKILSPGSYKSPQASFNFTCNGSAPQRTVGSPSRTNVPASRVQNTHSAVVTQQNLTKKINDTLHLKRKPVPHAPVQMQKRPVRVPAQNAGKPANNNNQ